MKKKRVSLSNELTLLMDATRGVHGLTRRWIESYGMLDAEAPDAISAMLVVIVERIRLIDRVVRGTVDPRLVLCAQNQSLPPQEGDEADVLLTVWSEKDLARHHRAGWKRARSRLKSMRGARREPRESPP